MIMMSDKILVADMFHHCLSDPGNFKGNFDIIMDGMTISEQQMGLPHTINPSSLTCFLPRLVTVTCDH